MLFVELYCYITYCVSGHQCLVPGHLGSIGMIMRILKMTVIIFIDRCSEQIVCIGNVWYVPATEVLESSPRHGIHCLRFLLFILSASSQRFGSRSVQATTLTCTSFENHEDWLISLFHAVFYELLLNPFKAQVSETNGSV
jgi:hypothetical protein